MKAFRILMVFILFFSWPAFAFAIGIEVAVGAWQQNPAGTIAYQALTVNDELDIENDAKYDDEIKLMGRAKIDMPLFIPNIYLMATPMTFEGNGSKTLPFTFGGKAFSAVLPFYSKVTLDHYDVALFWNVPFLKTATLKKVNVDFGIDARFIALKAEVRQDSTSQQASTSENLVLPMVYVGAQIMPVKWLSIEAEARGTSYSGDHYYDFIGRLKVKPLGPVFIAAGYRYEDVDVEEKDIKAKLTFAGPFLEGGIQF